MRAAPLESCGRGPATTRGDRWLREGLLHLGSLLGMSVDESITFVEAAAGRAWPNCSNADLRKALDEYRTVAAIIGQSRRTPSSEAPDVAKRISLISGDRGAARVPLH